MGNVCDTDSSLIQFCVQVMLLENAMLVLAASDILTEASWESLTVPTAVLCSFLLGERTSDHYL